MLEAPYGWIWAGGFFVVLLAAMAVVMSPIVVNGYVKRVGRNNDDEAIIRVRALYGLLQFKYKVPIMKWTGTAVKMEEQISAKSAGIDTWKQFEDEINADKVARSIDRLRDILHMVRDLTGLIRKTMSHVKLTDWRWTTSVGTGDAMWTAMATGAVWSIKTSILGVLSQMVQIKNNPSVSVNPSFNHPAFTTEWSCIAQIRLGYAILAGLQLLVRMKRWKGGVKAWQNTLFKA
ncbi:DUF2953 domain-containing protein [Paenibacillus sp. PL2-23]|uniref:DUF2953 domain-containing protein n=1 Tax=Paenibacillus sp. PL2-23 TaxID=2100729 RepID=UPI0030F8D100